MRCAFHAAVFDVAHPGAELQQVTQSRLQALVMLQR